ncbi:hypothetical protein BSR28_06160 [Boudabousia liubingyangii]|uniref:DUF6900 domain-containing protein n=1 Tax=Boudabousia liubingyangii TaxID=1921764 RepID=UPI00093EB43F|nr:hypothetical protein [Boudabousia liubingyangii]OKL47000.1 hypothetical protein BSR28_06160 [Boudabousia liubingyangii]
MNTKNTTKEETEVITTGALRIRLEAIAKADEYAGIDTLLSRGSDGFDWAEMTIGSLRRLMEQAFQAGLDAAHTEGITQVVKTEDEVYTEADTKVIHPAPQIINDEDEAARVGSHGIDNVWIPIGEGKYALIYTTWANATGWRKVPAIYTKQPGGTYQLATWNEEGFDNNYMRAEGYPEALTWAINNA